MTCPLARWDLTVAAYASDVGHAGRDDALGRDFFLAVVQRRHRLFSIGDVAILRSHNGGGDRQPAYCRTAKGRTVRNYFVPYARYARRDGRHVRHEGRTLMRIVEHPDVLEGLPPGDPAVRRYVVEDLLLAGGAASRVGEGSPGNPKRRDEA